MMDEDFFGDTGPKGSNPPAKEDANMDWKKNGIDKHERLTLKINVKEANAYSAENKRDQKSKNKIKSPAPKGFKKISKKIRDVYDDEDEEDGDYILIPVFMGNEISSLEKALTPEERKILEQMEKPGGEDILLRQMMESAASRQQAEQIVKGTGLNTDDKIIAKQQAKAMTVGGEELAAAVIKELSKRQPTKANQKEEKAPPAEDKPVRSAKQKPKIKDAEAKDNRKTLIDDSEKEKKSAQKIIEKQKEANEEVKPVTKEKVKEEQKPDQEQAKSIKENAAEQQLQKTPQTESKEEKLAKEADQNTMLRQQQKEEKQKEEIKHREEDKKSEKQELDEKNGEIILEKSGRKASAEKENKLADENRQRELDKNKEREKELELEQEKQQRLLQRSKLNGGR